MNTEFDGVCIFCGKTEVDIAHVSACSLEDAKEKLKGDDALNGDLLTKLMQTISMIKTYEAATEEEQSLMYMCTHCRNWGFAPQTSPICPSCKSLYTVVPVSEYVIELSKEDEDVSAKTTR